jgi:hypothetical protein
VIGGVRAASYDPYITYDNRINEVELISFDPRNNPVPDRLGNINRFPGTGISGGGSGSGSGGVGGALSTSGKSLLLVRAHFW